MPVSRKLPSTACWPGVSVPLSTRLNDIVLGAVKVVEVAVADEHEHHAA